MKMYSIKKEFLWHKNAPEAYNGVFSAGDSANPNK